MPRFEHVNAHGIPIMLRTDEILSTIEMLHAEHLDVRTVTLAINIQDCCALSNVPDGVCIDTDPHPEVCP
jgi:hypothetical protein